MPASSPSGSVSGIMSWPAGKYQQQHAASASPTNVSADSETWSDYVPVTVHSVPLESTARTAPYSPPVGGRFDESHNDRDIENLAMEIAELQQMMDRVGSNAAASPPRALSAVPDASHDQVELREQAQMLHHYYVSTLGSSDSASPIAADANGSSRQPDEGDTTALLRELFLTQSEQLTSAKTANVSLQQENAALAKLLAEHLPHLREGQNQAPIEPTALDLPNSLKYSSAVNKAAPPPEAVTYEHFATSDLTALRSFVDQLDIDNLPIDFARASVEDATSSLVAINMLLAKKLQLAGSIVADSEDAWKPAALAAQAQNVELQGIIADLNKRAMDLTQALDKSTFQSAQNSTQAQRDLLLVQNDLALTHSKKEGELKTRIQELDSELARELAVGRDTTVKFASLLEQHTAILAQFDEVQQSNSAFREQLPILQAQLESAQRELELQSRNSAALLTDSARASKLESDFSASLQHSKKLQEQLIASEKIVTAATAAKNEAEHKALKATQAHESLSVEFTLLKSECIAKDSKISSLQESGAMLKEAVLLLTQKNESLSDSLRGTDMMNSDAVSIIDSLHSKERSLNEEKASLQLQVQELQHRIQELQASQLKGGEEMEQRVLQLQGQLEQILKSEAETRAALQQETANLATTLDMNSDAIAFIENLKESLKNLEEVSIPDLKQRMQSEVDAETAKVIELSLERERLLAAREESLGKISELQQQLQRATAREGDSQMMIAELQQQLQVEKETSQQQAIALSSALEGAAASSRNMEEHNAAAMAVAKTILDQLQMTNESGQSYGNTLVQVLAGIETEINSLHDLLRATSGTVGASTAATVQLRQLHQVEMHRLQSEIEAQRSQCTHVAADLAAKTEKYEAQVAKLQNDLDRISQAEAAAKQALSHDSENLALTMEMNNEAIRYIEALREQYRTLENHSASLKSEMQQEAAAAAERLRKCKEEHSQQLQAIQDLSAANLESANDLHRRAVDDMRRRHSEQMAALETTSRGLHAEQQRQQKVHTDVQQVAASNNAIGEPDRHISSPHQLLPSAPSPSSTVQLRLGDVKKRLDSKLSELMNVQVPSSAKVVADQQAANAKLLDALRSRMLDVGASRTAVRLPSLLPPGGEASNPASILENISTQLQAIGPSNRDREINV